MRPTISVIILKENKSPLKCTIIYKILNYVIKFCSNKAEKQLFENKTIIILIIAH